MRKTATRFREGMRVRCVSYAAGVQVGTLGTVATVAGVRGRSIWCDPSRHMVFVQWDTGHAFGVFRCEAEEVSA